MAPSKSHFYIEHLAQNSARVEYATYVSFHYYYCYKFGVIIILYMISNISILSSSLSFRYVLYAKENNVMAPFPPLV